MDIDQVSVRLEGRDENGNPTHVVIVTAAGPLRTAIHYSNETDEPEGRAGK